MSYNNFFNNLNEIACYPAECSVPQSFLLPFYHLMERPIFYPKHLGILQKTPPLLYLQWVNENR